MSFSMHKEYDPAAIFTSSASVTFHIEQLFTFYRILRYDDYFNLSYPYKRETMINRNWITIYTQQQNI